MKKSTTHIILSVVLLASLAEANSKKAHSGEFLALGAGARAIGMGEAYTALAQDPSALYWNPAALTAIGKESLLLSHTPYMESSYYDFAAYGRRLGAANALGLSVNFLSAGKVPQTNIAGDTVKYLDPNDLAVSAGYAHRFSNGLSLGLAAKFINSNLLDSAQTGALDIGVLSPPLFKSRLQMGMTASNIGGSLKYDQVAEKLPVSLRAGASFRLSRLWLASLDAGSSGGTTYLATGLEYAQRVTDSINMAVRAGFNNRAIENVTGTAGLSMGLGLEIKEVAVDYAYRFHGNDWASHHITLGFHWGGQGRSSLPPHVQALVDEGQKLLEENQLPEAILKFNEALAASPRCKEALEGISLANRYMIGK